MIKLEKTNGYYDQLEIEGRKVYLYRSKKLFNPNIYLIQDGQQLGEIENNIVGKIDDNNRDIVVIFIESLDRNSEYTPWYSNTLVESIEYFSGNGDDYLKFLIDKLIPYISEVIDLDIFEHKIFLGGSSLGGLISTYGLFQYPDIFAGGIFVSSSYWYSNFIEYLSTRETLDNRKIIYMDVGGREKAGKITLNKDVVEETELVYKCFLNKGVLKKDILFRIHKDMTHELSYFVDRIYDGISYIETKI